MKFILNETKKFTLEEKFILNEADDEITLDDLITDKPESENTELDLEQNTGNTSWGSGWKDLYDACLESKDIPAATEKFWNGGLPMSIKEMSEEDRAKNFPIVSEKENKGYYVGEWGKDDGKIIKNIQAALKEELDSFGWTADTNPFVHYLKYLQDPKIKKLQKLTKDTYHYIHNAFIDKHITKEDLFGKGIFGTKNLIFTDAFLNLSTNGAAYLDHQHWLATNYTLLGIENLPATTALLNLFDASGNLQNLAATPKVNTITTLRPLEEIKAFTESKGKKEITNTEKEIVTDDDIKNLIKSYSAEAGDVLAYLALHYHSQDWFKKLDSDTFTKLKNNQTKTTLTFEEIDKYDKAFKAKKFSQKQLQSLITKLAKKL